MKTKYGHAIAGQQAGMNGPKLHSIGNTSNRSNARKSTAGIFTSAATIRADFR